MKTKTNGVSKILAMIFMAMSPLYTLASNVEIVPFEGKVSASGKDITILAELEDYPSQIQIRGQGADGENRIPIVGEPLAGGKLVGFLATHGTANKLCQMAGYVSGRVDTIGTQMDASMDPVLPINWWKLDRKAGIQYNEVQKEFEVVPHTQGGYLSIAACCRTNECYY
ncbi:MAG: hypothetical protein JNM39_13145 [Bdellovibrionaceae bacterium]|nr:hypothetical protein [Pseudobdellovibrionaceae bacterium]